MDLPDRVHALSLGVAFEDREMTLHPSAVETERGLRVLDTGLRSTVDQLTERLDDAGFALEDVATVLVTHQDGDHAGGLSAVVERSGATVVAHERDAPAIDGCEDPGGPPGRERYPPARVDPRTRRRGDVSYPRRAGTSGSDAWSHHRSRLGLPARGAVPDRRGRADRRRGRTCRPPSGRDR